MKNRAVSKTFAKNRRVAVRELRKAKKAADGLLRAEALEREIHEIFRSSTSPLTRREIGLLATGFGTQVLQAVHVQEIARRKPELAKRLAAKLWAQVQDRRDSVREPHLRLAWATQIRALEDVLGPEPNPNEKGEPRP